ncbi:UNVERIFIED_CONTAM: hypothetical protein NCL1_08724 [Trichonephila clavipes]
MEAGWSTRPVARQLGRSDCVVMRCWDQWMRVMSFTRRPGSGRLRQTSRREDRHIGDPGSICTYNIIFSRMSERNSVSL